MANRQRDLGKERMWREVLTRWRRSGQTVPLFCAVQGLAPSAFYSWRRIIAQRDREVATTIRSAKPLDIDADLPAFLPINIAATPTAAVLEIVVGHRVVRVPAGFDAQTLQQLLAVLEGPSC